MSEPAVPSPSCAFLGAYQGSSLHIGASFFTAYEGLGGSLLHIGASFFTVNENTSRSATKYKDCAPSAQILKIVSARCPPQAYSRAAVRAAKEIDLHGRKQVDVHIFSELFRSQPMDSLGCYVNVPHANPENGA